MNRVHLLTIDPQNSFCEKVPPADQQRIHSGELYVPGADDDMKRLADFVRQHGRKLDDIHVTMDSHQSNHIAHPTWFRKENGEHPDPFTAVRLDGDRVVGQKINLSDGSLGPDEVLQCAFLSQADYTRNYLKQLLSLGRYGHTLWPPHCLIGTPGHNIVPCFFEALDHWCQQNGATVDFVTKGSNPRCEHFSAVMAEVPDPNDLTTQINTDFIDVLMNADEILCSGEALYHCVGNTLNDIANCFSGNDAQKQSVGVDLGSKDEFVKKCVLLEDATSPVPGIKSSIIDDLKARGLRVSTTVDYFA